MNPCQGTGQCFEESLWGRKLVKNLENFIFSMDNKTAFLQCEKLCRSQRLLSTRPKLPLQSVKFFTSCSGSFKYIGLISTSELSFPMNMITTKWTNINNSQYKINER